MLHQKRKRAAREERILQQEESPGVWQKFRYEHQKAARNIGFALVVTFVFVPILFVLLYVRADNIYNEDIPGADIGSGLIDMGENDYYPDDFYNDLPVMFEPQDPDINTGSGENGEQSNTGQLQDPPEPENQPAVITGTAYLTFDDGPSRPITPGILDVLKEEGITATFFSLPYSGAEDIFKRILDEGHELGNHSSSHDYDKLYKGKTGAFRDDVLRARRFIEEHFGYSSNSLRFPGGAMNQSRDVRAPRVDVLRELGYRHFDWDIDTDDWRRGRTPEEIVETVLTNTKGKEHVIILMHDTYERTLEALPAIIAGLREQGYIFDIVRNHP